MEDPEDMTEAERQRRIGECAERIEGGEHPSSMMYGEEYHPEIVLDALDLVVARGSS